jgi:hypothetical protein
VCVEAANVMDIALELFYPTPESRKELLTLLVSRGGVVEVNFLWPPPLEVRWRCSAAQCSAVQRSVVQCSAVQCNEV